MSPEEEQTWSAIQQKDQQAFETYYKKHYTYFFVCASKFLKETGQAQEIVNDVFMKIWEDSGKINIEFSLKSYIYRAIINRSLNALEKNNKERENQNELSRRPEEAFELREMEENELKIKLYSAIDQLPEQCQKVFKMSRFEELKQQEIANQLGISIKTVKNHITLALKKLTVVLVEAGRLPLLITVIIDILFK